jgi:anti-anti-sigma factor
MWFMTLTVSPAIRQTAAPTQHPLIALTRVEIDGVVVTLRGEADAFSRTALAAVLSLVVSTHSGNVAIDLAELTFIDSRSAQALDECRNLLRRQGRELTLRSPRNGAVLVLNALGLSDLVEHSTNDQQQRQVLCEVSEVT